VHLIRVDTSVADGGNRGPAAASPRPRRRSRRVRRHALLAVANVLATVLVFGLVDSDDPIFRASMATAYVAFALLTITLAFGPVAALRGQRYPVSTDIRRDYGIWSGIVALAHVVVGLQVHLRGKMAEYFVRAYGAVTLPRVDAFGFANYAGLAAIAVLVVLLVTSNDVSLRRLGTHRWRTVHRFAWWALALSITHGVAYQLIEKRRIAFVLFFGALVGMAAIPRLLRRRRAQGGTP